VVLRVSRPWVMGHTTPALSHDKSWLFCVCCARCSIFLAEWEVKLERKRQTENEKKREIMDKVSNRG
jgi:hypothetical protein